MFKHFLIASIRNIRKHRFYSSINILGFALGLSIVLLLSRFIAYEFSYDQYIEESEKIFRVNSSVYTGNQLMQTSARSFLGLGPAMKEEVPEVDDYVRIWKNLDATRGIPFRSKEEIFYELNVYYVDSTFLDFFSIQMLYGSTHSALTTKEGVVLSKSTAQRFFGIENPVGMALEELAGETINRTVTGVYEDLPENSHLKFDILIPLFGDPNYTIFEKQPWYSTAWYTYVKLKANSSIENIENKLQAIVRNNRDYLEGETKEEVKLSLAPLNTLYLESHLADELKVNGSSNQLYLLITISALLLIICAINYSNVSIALALDRSKEIGVRKSFGALASGLRLQFFIDSFLINLIAVFFAVVLYFILYPYLEQLINKRIPVDPLLLSLSVVLLLIFSTLLSGSYPAYALSSFKPVEAFRGKRVRFSEKVDVKKPLVVFQFIVSIILIIWALNFYAQIGFLQGVDVGLNTENTLIIHNPTVYSGMDNDKREQDFLAFKNELLKNSQVESVTTSSSIPGSDIGFTYVDMLKPELTAKYDPTAYKLLYVGYDYVDLMQLHLVAGRNFSEESAEDVSWKTVILNTEAIYALGYKSPQEALNEFVYFNQIDDWEKLRIIGVVDNYHHKSLKESRQPIIFYLNQDKAQLVYYSIRFNSSNHATMLELVREEWSSIYPDKPFNYSFLEDHYNAQYSSDNNLLKVITLSAVLVILISSLGLLNLSLFDGKKRAKEIGVRKVLGASDSSIISLLLSDFMRLMLLASLIACPVAYFIVERWLEVYPVKIDFQWAALIIAVSLSCVVIILSTLYSAYRATGVNPARILKSE